MSGTKTFVALAVFIGLASSSAVFAKDGIDTRDHPGGAVVPCSLAGVNPAYHPEVFANPAIAASMGFVRGADGIWRVGPTCHR